MPEKENQSNPVEEIRQRAEKIARKKGGQFNEKLEDLSIEEAMNLLHELQVHQIELELQNVELRRVQTELEISREKYFDLYDLAPVGYITINEKGIIQQANLTAGNQLGMTRKALINKPLTRFILLEDEDIYYFLRKSLFETGLPRECELRMIEADNTPLWVRLEASVGQDSEGSPLGRLSSGAHP
jgi:two-component system cell cycle sensor histidine kinase/response regulator CckA